MKNLLLILLVAVTSCGEKQEKEEDSTKPQKVVTEDMDFSGSYVLVQLRGEEISFSENISLRIDEDRKEVMGNAGCNRFSTQYEREGNKISFQRPGSTKMFCEGKMEMEKDIIDLFSTISEVQQDGEYVVFISENGDPVFRANKINNRE